MLSKEMHDQLCEQAFSNEAHFKLNKALLIRFGPQAAVFITALYDWQRYFKRQGSLKENDWFFCTHEKLMQSTGISSEYALRECKKIFTKLHILETKKIGLPAKEYYRFNNENMASALGLDLPKTEGLDLPKTEGLITNNNNTKNNKEYISKEIYTSPSVSVGQASHFDQFVEMFPTRWNTNPTFLDAVKNFYAFKREKRRGRPSLRSLRMVVNRLLPYSVTVAVTALNLAVEKEWATVYPESVQLNQSRRTNHSSNSNGSRHFLPTSTTKPKYQTGEKYVRV
jgi:hypothetical protein